MVEHSVGQLGKLDLDSQLVTVFLKDKIDLSFVGAAWFFRCSVSRTDNCCWSLTCFVVLRNFSQVIWLTR